MLTQRNVNIRKKRELRLLLYHTFIHIVLALKSSKFEEANDTRTETPEENRALDDEITNLQSDVSIARNDKNLPSSGSY